MTYQKPCSTDGFVLFDVILALTLSVVFVGLLSYASLNARSVYDRALIKRDLLNTYQVHTADFDGLMPGSSTRHIYSASSSTPSVSISATARWYGNDRIETDIEASSSSGRSLQLRAVRKYPYESDMNSAGTSLCAPEYGPHISITPIMLPIDASLPLTDIQVRNGIAYITSDSNRQADPDLFVVDIHDPGHPLLLSSLNTGPGLQALTIAGSYVYAAAASTAAQLHVIRLASLASLQLVKKYQLPPPEASTSPPVGTAIWYDNGRVYLGTEKWNGQEFVVVDVHSPESPSYMGGLETGSKVNYIFVRNGLAYVAASDQSQLRTVDVHGQIPVLMGAFTPSGWARQEGSSVVSFENDLGFGRTSGGFDILADKEMFAWEASSSVPSSLNVPGGIYGLVMSRSRIFAITHTIDEELSVFGRTLGSTTVTHYALPVLPQAMTCDLDKIYILAKTAPAIYEITFN